LFVIALTIRHLHLPPDGRWVVLFILATLAGILVYLCLEKPLAKLTARADGKRQETTKQANA